MKRIAKIILLICIMAGLFGLNAYAVDDFSIKGDVQENKYYFNVTSDREAIGFNIVFPAPETLMPAQ